MYNWRKTQLKPEDTMDQAIEVLNREALRIALVVDDDGRLLGTITDGDIRRALINKCGMETTLDRIMCGNPTVAFVNDKREYVLSMMKNRNLLHIPLLDNEGCLVDLETLQNITQKPRYDNRVFLMAGGFGKRLQPLTDDVPKPLLNVGAKPVLAIILEQFIDTGFRNFIISTHYKAEMIKEYFGDGKKWDVKITYIYEDKPLGTGGALGLLPEDLPDLPIIMMNGDLLTKMNYEHLLEYHNEQGGIATMCVREYDFRVPYGVVKINDNKILKIEEKPVHKFFVNAGIYVLEPRLIEVIKKDMAIDMPNLLGETIDKGSQVNIYPIHEYWVDIGRMEEFERAKNDFGSVFK